MHSTVCTRLARVCDRSNVATMKRYGEFPRPLFDPSKGGVCRNTGIPQGSIRNWEMIGIGRLRRGMRRWKGKTAPPRQVGYCKTQFHAWISDATRGAAPTIFSAPRDCARQREKGIMCRFSISAECQPDKFYLADLLGMPKEASFHAQVTHSPDPYLFSNVIFLHLQHTCNL